MSLSRPGRKLFLALLIAFITANAPIVHLADQGAQAARESQAATYAELDSPDADIRAAAVQSIRAAADVEAVPALLAHLDDEDQRVGLYIAQALAELAPPKTLVELRAILWRGNIDARWRAAYVLGEQRDFRAVPVLARALRDQEVMVARYAAEALGNIGGVAATRALIDSLGSARESEVNAARNGLLLMGNAAVPLLDRALESPDPRVEVNAELVLYAIGTPEARAALLQIAQP